MPKRKQWKAVSTAVRKFCSTQDMLSWWLQPENQHLQAELYVHDVAKTPWEHPQDEHLIDARTAFYVLGSSVQGAMGPSLVSFGTREAAELFADTKGGRVLSWQQMDLAVLQELASAGHEHAAAHGEQLQHEHGVTVEADEHGQHNRRPRAGRRSAYCASRYTGCGQLKRR